MLNLFPAQTMTEARNCPCMLICVLKWTQPKAHRWANWPSPNTAIYAYTVTTSSFPWHFHLVLLKCGSHLKNLSPAHVLVCHMGSQIPYAGETGRVPVKECSTEMLRWMRIIHMKINHLFNNSPSFLLKMKYSQMCTYWDIYRVCM